MQFYQLICVDP